MATDPPKAWLDTNVILRYLLKDHEEYFKTVYPLFEKASRGHIVLLLHPLILAELVWTLESYYEYSKEEIRRSLSDLIEADGIEVPDRWIVRDALANYDEKHVDYIDAYLASHARHKGPGTIYTLDRKHFSRIKGDIITPGEKE